MKKLYTNPVVITLAVIYGGLYFLFGRVISYDDISNENHYREFINKKYVTTTPLKIIGVSHMKDRERSINIYSLSRYAAKGPEIRSVNDIPVDTCFIIKKIEISNSVWFWHFIRFTVEFTEIRDYDAQPISFNIEEIDDGTNDLAVKQGDIYIPNPLYLEELSENDACIRNTDTAL